MVRDIYSMKEYLMKELEGIEDRGTLHEILCTVLEWKGIPYMTVRRAYLRGREKQLPIFGKYRTATRSNP